MPLSDRPVSPAEAAPDPAAVARELERLAVSNSFRKAERCMRLLRHLTSMAIEGRGGELKEYSLGVAVFDRPTSYDPSTDAIVRLEARRLRLKLAEYYQQEGLDDPVIIDVPKGAYVPDFRFRRAPQVAMPQVAMPQVAMETQPPPPQPNEPLHPRRRQPIWLAAAILLATIAGTSWYLVRKRSGGVQARATIAVLGFRNLSPRSEESWISSAVSELMNIELGAEPRFRVAPLENVARMRSELSLTPQATYPVQILQRIRMNLGADYVITGAYLPEGHHVHLDVMLFDVRSGRQVAAIGDDAGEDSLPGLSQRCAQRVQAQLGIRFSANGYSSFEAAAVDPYARGMDYLRQGDALNAQTYLEKAAAIAPSNPLIHSGLAAAWSALGLDIRAEQEAKLAFESSAALGRVEQLEIEGRYRTIAHAWPRAIQVYQALFTLLPDDLEYGLLLAAAETAGGKSQDALAMLKNLRALPSPQRDDPRIDLAEARAAGALGDYVHTRRAARAAAEKAQAHGARLQYAKSRLLESGAMQNLSVAGFANVRAEARQICAELGDRACVAAAYRIEANNATVENLAEAQRLYQSVLEIANQMGNALEKLNAFIGLAYVANLQGDLPSADRYYQAALAVAEEMGQQKSYSVRLDMAEVKAEEGHLAEARALVEQALQFSRGAGDREGMGLSQAAAAHLLALEGKNSAALDQYREALVILREVNDPFLLGEALLEAGNTQLEAGDVEAARKSFAEARSLAQANPGNWSAEVEVAFARLGFAEGDFADAESQARAALSGFTTSGREGDRLEAAAILARILVAQGHGAEASQVLAQVPAPDPGKLPAESQFQFQVSRCFVLAQTGRREEALRAMDAIRANAARTGIPKLEKDVLQARKAVARAQDHTEF